MQRRSFHSFNWRMLLRIMGWLLMIEAGFMIVPVIVGLGYGESDWRVFAVTAAATAAVGGLLARFSSPGASSTGRRENFLLIAMVWVIFSLFGMLPFIFCSTPQSVTVSFFEAISDFTTTGACALTDVASMSHAVTMWRALMQWLGGLGIILFTLAVLPMLNSAAGMQMFNNEISCITHDKLRPRISQTAIALWKLYIALTAACALLLWLGPMDAFDAVCHAFGTLSTGGFSSSPTGIDVYDSVYVKIVITVFMILGGIKFMLIFKMIDLKFAEVWQNNTFRLYIALIAVCIVLFIFSSWYQAGVTDLETLTLDSTFRVVSTVSTTGYSIGTPSSYGSLASFLLLPLIFFGGCAGSTSGGAKLDRAIVAAKFAANETRRALIPNSVFAVKAGNTVLPEDAVRKSLAFIFLYLAVIASGALILTLLNVPGGDAMIAALTTIGNATSDCHGAYLESIPSAGLWVLSAIMVIGRLEIYTVFVIFLHQFRRR